MQEDQSPKFLSLEDNVFYQHPKTKKIYIGKTEISAELASVLQRDAEVFLNSRLFSVLNASIVNESYDLALKQSTDFDQVKSAKMLHHWNFFLIKMIIALSKVDKT
jgi:hypothetical protein